MPPIISRAEVEYSPPIRAYLEAELVASGSVYFENNQTVMVIDKVLRNQTDRLYMPTGKVVFGRDRYGPFSIIHDKQPEGKYLLFFKTYNGKMYLYAGSQHIYKLDNENVYPICAADSVFELNLEDATHALLEYQRCFMQGSVKVKPGITATKYKNAKGYSAAVLYALQNPFRLLNPYIDEPIETMEPLPIPKEDTTIYQVVEQMPEFPSGNNELYKLVQSIVKYPPEAKELGIQGRVYVRFVVEKDGAVTNVEVVRGVNDLLDEEAVRVIETLPAFEPAKQRGKPVRCYFMLPIPFKLD